MSHLPSLVGGDARSVLVTGLGSDFHHAIAPFKAEILEIAQYLHGDVHRAAMRLLIERQGRRPAAIEQQLIIAALAELQAGVGEAPPPPKVDPWQRATARVAASGASGHRSEVAPLQVH